MSQPAARALVAKIDEQVERLVHLIGLLPAGGEQWIPPIPGSWPVGQLLGHLLDCLAGFCAVLSKAFPEQLSHFSELRSQPVNRFLDADAARQSIAIYRRHLDEGFALLTDSGLVRALPTVFVAEGEPVITLLLGNLEHLINHKQQLFLYLRWMGVKVGTADLYRFRGA